MPTLIIPPGIGVNSLAIWEPSGGLRLPSVFTSTSLLHYNEMFKFGNFY